jgi:hypothetical protein
MLQSEENRRAGMGWSSSSDFPGLAALRVLLTEGPEKNEYPQQLFLVGWSQLKRSPARASQKQLKQHIYHLWCLTP